MIKMKFKYNNDIVRLLRIQDFLVFMKINIMIVSTAELQIMLKTLAIIVTATSVHNRSIQGCPLHVVTLTFST